MTFLSGVYASAENEEQQREKPKTASNDTGSQIFAETVSKAISLVMKLEVWLVTADMV